MKGHLEMSRKEEKIEKEQAEKEKKAYSKGKLDGIIFVAVALGFFIVGCCSTYLITNKLNSTKDDSKDKNTSSLSSTVDSNSEQTELSRELVTGDARADELENVNKIMSNLRSSNVAFIVENSSGYDGYIYNKHGECIQQNSDSSVSTLFTSDGHSVRINAADGTIALDGSIDILTSCENVLANAANGTDGYSVYKTQSNTDEDGVTYSSCIVNIKGFDACKTLYENLGDEMSESAIEKIKQLVDESYAEANDGAEFDWTPEFEYVFVYSDKDQFGMQCNCIINGEAQNNWYADGYQETQEWKLSDVWNDIDWADNTTENFDDICEKLTNELELIDKVLNIEEDTDSNSESSADKNESSTADNE